MSSRKTATVRATGTSRTAAKQAALDCDPPIKDHDGVAYRFVLISSVVAPFTGPETYLFPLREAVQGDKPGDLCAIDIKYAVVSYGELPGSERGETTHRELMERLGYELIEPKLDPTDIPEFD